MSKNILVDLSDALAEAAERAGDSTVLVNARWRIPASGIVYADDLILTANHVVERDEDISVALPDGTELSATVAGRDPGSDLALLKLEQVSATPAGPAKTPARVGQIALALGRPSKAGIEASLGTVSAIGGTPVGMVEFPDGPEQGYRGCVVVVIEDLDAGRVARHELALSYEL